MTDIKSILIMAGGTGGHVFPALAVAKQLKKQGITVHWLGTRQGMEAKLVDEAGFPLYFIQIKGLRGKGIKRFITMPWQLLVATFQAQKIIRQLNPDVVLGMGGFVSGPGGVASWLLGKKLIIHEQNAKAGLTNRCLATVATRILEGFPKTFSSRLPVITTGNPVREDIALLPPPQERNKIQKEPLKLLVLGGSLGAEAINQLLPRVLSQLPSERRPVVYHQTGEKHADNTQKAYAAAGIDAKVVPFIANMSEAYAWADIVLCRAGALTIAELCAAGVGAILIPFPHAVDDHQTANAHYMADQGAALLIPQATLSDDSLRAILEDLYQSADKRQQMAQAAYQLRKIDATEKVCKEICY